MVNDTVRVNLELGRILREWDPFQVGGDFYDTETADAIQAVHQWDEPEKLADALQLIYEFSFEQRLDNSSCLEVAKRLLLVKQTASCEL